MRDISITRREFLSLGTALVAGALASSGYVACEGAVANKKLFPGIRFFPGLGVRGGDTSWSGDAAYVGDYYARFGAPREARWFSGTPRYWFIAEKKLQWRDLLVDETVAPSSHAQAQDPSWSNYRWNQRDVIANMLGASAISNNRAKLGILLAGTATSTPYPVPLWMFKKRLAWRDSGGNDHVRQDLDQGWKYLADFYTAFARRYGDEQKISHIALGEYYPGDGQPSDLNPAAFRSNVKNVWKQVTSNAPQNSYGERMSIVQINPVLTGGYVTATDIADAGVGVSGSDPHLFRNGCGKSDGSPCDPGSLDGARQDLSGVVPLHNQCDANIFKSGVASTWSGIANPFGYTQGQVVPVRLEQILWYFGSKGVVPENAITVKDDPALTDDWFPAFDRFGPNGTGAAAWGQLPNYTS